MLNLLLLSALLATTVQTVRADPWTDPLLVELTDTAEFRDSGLRLPLFCTAQVQHRYVKWTRRDNRRQTYQDTTGRRWDLCYMLAYALKAHIRRMEAKGQTIQSGQSTEFIVYAVPRDGLSRDPEPVTLRCTFHTCADGIPMLLVSEPSEVRPWSAQAAAA